MLKKANIGQRFYKKDAQTYVFLFHYLNTLIRYKIRKKNCHSFLDPQTT